MHMPSAERALRRAKIASTVYNKEVYEPSDDSFALVDALQSQFRVWGQHNPAVCVEVGCGSGYVICSLALMLQDLGLHCACHATDLSEHALAATLDTLSNHRVQHLVDLVRTDLLSAFHSCLRHKVDLLLFNPPYVVTPDEEVTQGGIARAWAGGAHGRVVMDRLLADLHHFLSPNGALYMIAVEDNKPREILAHMKSQHGLDGEVVLTRRADEELIHVLRLSRPQAAVL